MERRSEPRPPTAAESLRERACSILWSAGSGNRPAAAQALLSAGGILAAGAWFASGCLSPEGLPAFGPAWPFGPGALRGAAAPLFAACAALGWACLSALLAGSVRLASLRIEAARERELIGSASRRTTSRTSVRPGL